jgi:hypothetical protein
LTIQVAATTSNAEDKGSILAAITAKAAKGVAQAKAKLASAQARVSTPKLKKGAEIGPTGACGARAGAN